MKCNVVPLKPQFQSSIHAHQQPTPAGVGALSRPFELIVHESPGDNWVEILSPRGGNEPFLKEVTL
jgi:hypothetical protein